MAQNLRVEDPQSVATLVGDIIQDAQKLVRQELALARSEVQHEWTKAKTATVIFGSAGVVLGLGGILLAFALVHILEAITGLPLWVDYGIMALAFLGAGAFLFYRGREAARQVDFVPRETVESIKENVQWIRNQT
jgi:hypothetical protein